MNRQQLVDAVGERVGDRRTAAVAVDAVLDTVTAALADGDRVALFGFGVFEKVDRAARTARNPATGGTVEVPATSVPRFRPGQALKDAVGGRPAGARRRAAGSTAPPVEAAPAEAVPAEAVPAEAVPVEAVPVEAALDRPKAGKTGSGAKPGKAKAAKAAKPAKAVKDKDKGDGKGKAKKGKGK